MAEASPASSQRFVGDPLTIKEKRKITEMLREAGILSRGERLIDACGEATVIFQTAGSSSLPNNAIVPSQLGELLPWVEEEFVSLEHLQGVATALQAIPGYGVDPITSHRIDPAVTAPKTRLSLDSATAAHRQVIQERLRSSAVHPRSSLGKFLDHINGFHNNHSATDTYQPMEIQQQKGTRLERPQAPYAGDIHDPLFITSNSSRTGGMDYISSTDLTSGARQVPWHGPAKSAASPARQRDILASPNSPKGGISIDEQTYRKFTETSAVDAHILVYEATVVCVVPIPSWMLDEAHAFAVKEQLANEKQLKSLREAIHGGTAFTGVDPPEPDDAKLSTSTLDASATFNTLLPKLQQGNWLRRKWSPFRDTPFFQWDGRGFLVRVIPAGAVQGIQHLHRRWRLDEQEGSEPALVRRLRAMSQQLSPAARAAFDNLYGVVITRTTTSRGPTMAPPGTGDATLSPIRGRVEQKGGASAPLPRPELALLWHGGGDDSGKSIFFILMAKWGQLDGTLRQAIERDRAVVLSFDTLRAKAVARRVKEGTSDALSATSHFVRPAVAQLCKFPDEHRALVSFFGLRTLLNPNSSAPLVQQHAAGCVRDVDGYMEGAGAVDFDEIAEVAGVPRGSLPKPIGGMLEVVRFACVAYHFSAYSRKILVPFYPPGARGQPSSPKESGGKSLLSKILKWGEKTPASQNGIDADGVSPEDLQGNFLRAMDHVTVIVTDNIVTICERVLKEENYGSDIKYRQQMISTMSPRAGNRVAMDFSSVLMLSVAEAKGDEQAAQRAHGYTVYRISICYTSKPLFDEHGNPGAFDPSYPDASIEVHRFYLCGPIALQEANQLQSAWLKYLGKAVGCGDATLTELKNTLTMFHGLAKCVLPGNDVELFAAPWSDPLFQNNPNQQPLPVRVSPSVGPCVATCRQLRQQLEQAVPSDVAATLMFHVLSIAGCTIRQKQERAQRRQQAKKQQQRFAAPRLLMFPQFLRAMMVLMVGTTRQRAELLFDALDVDGNEAFTHQALHVFLKQLSNVAKSEHFWEEFPSHTSDWVPKDEWMHFTLTAQSNIHQRLKGIGLLRDSTTARWDTAVFFSHPLWRPMLRVMLTVSVIAGHTRQSELSKRVSQRGGDDETDSPTRSTKKKNHGVENKWKDSLPWLREVEELPQRTHVFVQRKYQQQKIYSLETGALLDEVWHSELAIQRNRSFVIELCPDVFESLREFSGVRFEDIAKTLGVGPFTAGLLGGSFVGAHSTSLPYTNIELAKIVAGIRPRLFGRGSGELQAPRPLSKLIASAEEKYLVQFLDATGLHKLLAILPKYDLHLQKFHKSSLLPRYLGLYVACFAEDGQKASTNEELTLVFFAILLAPAHTLGIQRNAVGSSSVVDAINHIAGDVATPTALMPSSTTAGLGGFQASVEGAPDYFSGTAETTDLDVGVTPNVNTIRLDLSTAARKDLVARIKRDVAFLSDNCGFTHFSLMLAFTADRDSESGELVGVANGGAVGASSPPRRYMNTVTAVMKSGSKRSAAGPSPHLLGALPPRSTSQRVVVQTNPLVDESPNYLQGLSRLGGPLTKLSFNMDDDDDVLVNADAVYRRGQQIISQRNTSQWIPRERGMLTPKVATTTQGPYVVNEEDDQRRRQQMSPLGRSRGPPATWICSMCHTLNPRKALPSHREGSEGRRADNDPQRIHSSGFGVVKPCHVCFGTTELVEGLAVPVATSLEEYEALLKGARAETDSDLVSGGNFRFDGDLRLERPGTEKGVASPSKKRPVPHVNRDVPVDSFLRLAGAADRSNPLLGKAAELNQPGNAVVAANVDGREDVPGLAVLAIVDMLGLATKAGAEEPSVASRYGRTLIANVLEALGDDFL